MTAATATNVASGLILMLDALGNRNLSIEESKKFIATVDSAVTYFDIRHRARGLTVELRTFGDTVLLCFPFNEKKVGEILREATSCAALFISFCFAAGIPFRGAISVGEYIVGSRTILGPALIDAAMWHDKADWCGCMGTPKFTNWLNDKLLTREIDWQYGWYLYRVPLKGQAFLRTWALEWAHLLGNRAIDDANPVEEVRQLQMADLLSACTRIDHPIGTEQKYENAVKFFTYSLNPESMECNRETVLAEYDLAEAPTYGPAQLLSGITQN